MRRCLSVFMVVLLVLRGLVGDAMAMDLMPPVATAATEHAHHADAPLQSADTHCMPNSSAQHCSHDTDDNACSSCVLCHSAWSMQPTYISLPGLGQEGRPAHFATTPVNAPISSLIKPPIVGA